MKTNFFQVAAFYKFIQLDDLDYMQDLFLKFLQSHNIKGTVLIANEGINGTIAGNSRDINKIIKTLKKYVGLKILTAKIHRKVIFNHFIKEKLRLKKKWFH